MCWKSEKFGKKVFKIKTSGKGLKSIELSFTKSVLIFQLLIYVGLEEYLERTNLDFSECRLRQKYLFLLDFKRSESLFSII